MFREKTKDNDQAQQYYPEIKKMLQKNIKKLEEEMKVKNVQETKNFVKKEF